MKNRTLIKPSTSQGSGSNTSQPCSAVTGPPARAHPVRTKCTNPPTGTNQGRHRFDGTTAVMAAKNKGLRNRSQALIYSFNSDNMRVLTVENSRLIL